MTKSSAEASLMRRSRETLRRLPFKIPETTVLEKPDNGYFNIFLTKFQIQRYHLTMNIEKSDLQKIVIIGNSGSGKSYLALKLSELLGPKVIHLDQLFWEAGGFGKKRPTEIVHGELQQLSLSKTWIVEGVFGDLASIALENATALIFLNKSWTECETALKERGSESSKQLDPVQAEKNFQELLFWAKAYNERENSRSLKGHIKIFNDFQKTKFEFINRQECESWLKKIEAV